LSYTPATFAFRPAPRPPTLIAASAAAFTCMTPRRVASSADLCARGGHAVEDLAMPWKLGQVAGPSGMPRCCGTLGHPARHETGPRSHRGRPELRSAGRARRRRRLPSPHSGFTNRPTRPAAPLVWPLSLACNSGSVRPGGNSLASRSVAITM